MTSKRYDVLGIGIAAVDDILAVEKYPPPNVKVPVLGETRHGGGLACTAIAAVATLGGSAAFMARFGNDDLSSFIRGILAARKVDVSHIIPDAKGHPYHSRIIIDKSSGDRTIFYDDRHFRAVTADDVSEQLLASTRVLLLDFLSPPSPLALAAKARKSGIPVVLDVEGRGPEVGALLEQVDHLVVPEEFAQWFSGEHSPGAACASLAKVRRAATVVTAGASGCWWTDSPDRAPAFLPAFKVETFDTNGCGDTYHGAYALAIARDFSIADAVVFASACGALKAGGRAGGWNALPTASEVASFLHQRLASSDPGRPVIDRIGRSMVTS